MNVIGLGRLGGFFMQSFDGRGYRRSDSLASLEGPTLVCVRVGDLGEVLSQLKSSVKSDLIFVQNGFYDNTLKRYGIRDATKMVVYFAVSHRGAHPVDSGMSVVVGKHSLTLRTAMEKRGVVASHKPSGQWPALAHEKMIWLSVFGLMCELYDKTTSELVETHPAELEALMGELALICQDHLNIDFDGGFEGMKARLFEYSKRLGDYKASMKEFDDRNGYFLRIQSSLWHQKCIMLLDKKRQ